GVGGKCQNGKCARAKRCAADSDCAQDEECKGGVCVSGRPKTSAAASCTLDPIYFDFNEASVTTEGAATIQRDSECLKKELTRALSPAGAPRPAGARRVQRGAGRSPCAGGARVSRAARYRYPPAQDAVARRDRCNRNGRGGVDEGPPGGSTVAMTWIRIVAAVT